MGQYFLLINVDRREAIKQGKLAEGLLVDNEIERLLFRVVGRSSLIGPWAGHRLITAGDYMGECPAGMLTESEAADLSNWEKTRGEGFWSFADELFSQPPRPINYFKPPMAGEGQTLILRNLSKKLYVRAFEFAEYQRGKVQEISSLEGFIKINTAWSDDPSCCLPYEEDSPIVPGPWAGDRFDITFLETVDMESWQDVTEQQAAKMVKILKASELHQEDPTKRIGDLLRYYDRIRYKGPGAPGGRGGGGSSGATGCSGTSGAGDAGN